MFTFREYHTIEDYLKSNQQLYLDIAEAFQQFGQGNRFRRISYGDVIEAIRQSDLADCFDFERADFSPLLTENSDAAVTEVKHGVRVAIDEEGVKAAAYTVMMLLGGMPPTEIVTFAVDRPFIFVITGPSGMPLFVGIVNQV